MTDEQRELDKLHILVNAINSLQEDEPDFYAELKDAAWDVLHDNPGLEYGDWIDILINQYPTEVVDALGTNPHEVFAELEDMWGTMDYEDNRTGECHSFHDWAEYFASDRSVELYDLLVEAKREIRQLKAIKHD